MALEGLRDALAQAGRDYFNTQRQNQLLAEERAREDQLRRQAEARQDALYARARSDKLADETAAEARQIDAEQRAMANQLAIIKQRPAAEQIGLAATMGITNAEELAQNGQLYSVIEEKLQDAKVREMVAVALGGLAVADQTRDRRMAGEAKDNFDSNLGIYQAARNYGTESQALFDKLAAQNNDATLSAAVARAFDDAYKSSRFAAMSPADVLDAANEAGIATKDAQGAALPTDKIRRMLASSDELVKHDASTKLKLYLDAGTASNETRALVSQLGVVADLYTKAATEAMRRGINPNAPAESQSWFTRGAPEGFKMPSMTSPGSFLSPPGAPAAAPVVPPVVTPPPAGAYRSVDALVGAPAAVTPVKAPAPAVVAPAAPTVPEFFSPPVSPQTVMTRRNDAVADAMRASVQSVGNFFRPSSWQLSNGTLVLNGPQPEIAVEQLRSRYEGLADKTSPAAMALRQRINDVAPFGAAYFTGR